MCVAFHASRLLVSFFFFNDPATTEIYTLSLHRRSSDLALPWARRGGRGHPLQARLRLSPLRRPAGGPRSLRRPGAARGLGRSEEHTSELQSLAYLVCRLLLEKKKQLIH